MKYAIEFWKMGGLSDGEVIEGLRDRVASSRARVAEIVAHLGEVEERRLHLHAGCGSMFEYCVKRLGFSEDEACRRIDVARLARRFPAIFPKLASGELSLTVAGLLKPHLVEANASRLLGAVAGCSTARAREVIASFFPRPDAPTSIRKLPEPRAVRRPAISAGASDAPVGHLEAGEASSLHGANHVAPVSLERRLEPSVVNIQPSLPSIPSMSSQTDPAGEERNSLSSAPRLLPPEPATRLPAPARIEPLSPSRYKLQLTVAASLKQKLELARDLLRHAVPSGDHAVIIERGLDLLIDQQLRRRFGAKDPKATVRRISPAGDVKEPSQSMAGKPPAAEAGAQTVAPGAPRSRYVSRAVRRIVAERDGLRCSWVGGDGARCEARAWLELDHRCPLGKGGGSEAANMRHLCRAHNRLAAELEYGRALLNRFAAGSARCGHSEGPAGERECSAEGWRSRPERSGMG